jgi:hypothetical protein
MVLTGWDDESQRPGVECQNSWGSYLRDGNTHRLGVNDGAFWIDADVIDRMLRQGDSYALGSFHGFKKRDPSHLWL